MKLNTIVKRRLFALLVDYLVIVAYLIALFAVFGIIYGFILGTMPEFNELTSHTVSFLTTILPAVLFFSWLEYRPPYASIGKRRFGLQVTYANPSYLNALLRNIFKFLPWHIGHTGVIGAIYRNYSVAWFMLANAGAALAVIYILMVIFRKDHRHLGDLIARTRVEPQPETEKQTS